MIPGVANRTGSQLRDEILAAARAEFAQYGLTGARIERIAKGANASKERLYAHFGDKESLFRLVALTDAAEFFEALTLRPDAVPEFVGEIFDVLRAHPEHLRMMTWARLEGLSFPEPQSLGHDIPGRELSAIEAAQAGGHVDAHWKPLDLLVMLFGIGTAWADWPHQDVLDDADVAAHRAAAVEAAARIIAPRRRES
ncbi:TetR family transcriptional regulator [[Mycobacterium] nativiensis]|uniref:TetR family transcriptional regulator n=1 Tax=[Mycobacterium] nativiensis TaxID=2855503 RepID=A0ABU5XTW9_9MYCO|nr:TetR family transcriptional regulator [Mycolicibacter sp. MYC340]MEB3031424.1 TetR family transcriptional regulator [Mycolicibacter sp. MYC340]